MIGTASPNPDTAQAWLQHGQSLEAAGRGTEALAAYDEAIRILQAAPSDDFETRRQLGVVWMNRGNALQRLALAMTDDAAREPLAKAVAAYDEAIAFFQTLPLDTPAHRNHLGAAFLNRGHALLVHAELPLAIGSFEQAIAHLAELPLDEHPSYRLNLAGAWTNLAHIELETSPSRARIDAQTALSLVEAAAPEELIFAEMSLRARRALISALGKLLVAAEVAREPITALASEAGDAIDDGLALARQWEARGTDRLRPLALRLFRFGAQLYRVHQPHFLADFLLENIDPETGGTAFAQDPDFRATATEALQEALQELQRPRLLISGSRDAERALDTARSLRAAQQRLAELFAS
jgi:tetratricopeptide (TPR) repeat protein